MNILILAAGTRNKIVQYFKKTFEGIGTVVAADASKLGPAIYDADKYYTSLQRWQIAQEEYTDIIVFKMDISITSWQEPIVCCM